MAAEKFRVELHDARGVVIGDHNVVHNYFLSETYRPLSEHFLSFDDLIAERTEDFVGRAFLDAQLAVFLENHDRGYFVLVGEPGHGRFRRCGGDGRFEGLRVPAQPDQRRADQPEQAENEPQQVVRLRQDERAQMDGQARQQQPAEAPGRPALLPVQAGQAARGQPDQGKAIAQQQKEAQLFELYIYRNTFHPLSVVLRRTKSDLVLNDADSPFSLEVVVPVFSVRAKAHSSSSTTTSTGSIFISVDL